MNGGGIRALAIAATLAIAAPAAAQSPESRVIEMATGSVAAVYFPTGVSLCRLVNRQRLTHGLRCAARPSAGSVENARALRDGAVGLALLQSDVQSAAYAGSAPFADEAAFGELRTVMSLFPEVVTLVVRADSGIAGLDDLPGRRVSIGPPGSGQRSLMEALGAALGWPEDVFADEPEMRASSVAQALCAGEIDAFALVVGHPAPPVREATLACGATLVPVAGPLVDAFLAEHPQYVSATIPAATYEGQDADIESFGVTATLATRADAPDDDIARIVAAVFDGLESLRGLNPALVGLEPEMMARSGISAPLHPAAEAFYRERGWID